MHWPGVYFQKVNSHKCLKQKVCQVLAEKQALSSFGSGFAAKQYVTGSQQYIW